jgi:aminoglycoside phosphotransferase family enzyme
VPASAPDPTTEAKVAFLARPAAYADGPSAVQVVETHLSFVFLAEARVFKLKKPLRGARFDFRSVESRRRNALAELRLNRRLAPDTYVAVVPLGLSKDEKLVLGEGGRVVDWLVEMVRLPADELLDRRLSMRRWHASEIRRLGDRLAAFYSRAAPVRVPPPAFFEHLRRECAESAAAFVRTAQADLVMPAAIVARTLSGFIAANRALFLARLRGRRMVEGHGDLRPEHVALQPDIEVIDCLEFSRALRLVDPVDELAFLGMECRRQGAPQIARILFERYRRRTGDVPPPPLVAFYEAYRALIRARLAIVHLEDHEPATAPKWQRRAAEYLAIARSRIRLLRAATRPPLR